MDRFVEKNGPRSYAAVAARTPHPQIEAPALAYTEPTTDTEPDMEVSGAAAPSPSADATVQTTSPSSTERIAQAVAALLSPITASVEKVVSAGMQQLQAQLGEHASRLNETEHRIANIEEELYHSQSSVQAQDKTNIFLKSWTIWKIDPEGAICDLWASQNRCSPQLSQTYAPGAFLKH